MDNVKKRLLKAFEEANLSYRELEEKTGLSRMTIQRYITGDVKKIPLNKLEVLAKGLGTTAEYILGWDDTPADVYPIKKKQFKVLGEIACGQPIFANEDHETYINASSDIDADFCLVAKGDSMKDARINDGDVVFIKATSIVDNGSIAAVVIDDEATLKRWYFYPNEKKLILNPANPRYEPLVFMGKELNNIRCIGKAVCFMSNL